RKHAPWWASRICGRAEIRPEQAVLREISAAVLKLPENRDVLGGSQDSVVQIAFAPDSRRVVEVRRIPASPINTVNARCVKRRAPSFSPDSVCLPRCSRSASINTLRKVSAAEGGSEDPGSEPRATQRHSIDAPRIAKSALGHSLDA